MRTRLATIRLENPEATSIPWKTAKYIPESWLPKTIPRPRQPHSSSSSNKCGYCLCKGHNITKCQHHTVDPLLNSVPDDGLDVWLASRNLKELKLLANRKYKIKSTGASKPALIENILKKCRKSNIVEIVKHIHTTDECPICISPVDKINAVMLGCKHTFCVGCVKKHTQTKTSCPMCRAEIVKICVTSKRTAKKIMR